LERVQSSTVKGLNPTGGKSAEKGKAHMHSGSNTEERSAETASSRSTGTHLRNSDCWGRTYQPRRRTGRGKEGQGDTFRLGKKRFRDIRTQHIRDCGPVGCVAGGCKGLHFEALVNAIPLVSKGTATCENLNHKNSALSGRNEHVNACHLGKVEEATWPGFSRDPNVVSIRGVKRMEYHFLTTAH